MPKRTVYRTDTDDFEDGRVLTPRGDHYTATLDSSHKAAEEKIRAGHPAGQDTGTRIRSECVYVWENQDWAEKTWNLQKAAHLYELQIDLEDSLHVGDVDHYTAVSDAIARGLPTGDPVKKYWSGEIAGRRVERLVRKATVMKKLKDKGGRRSPIGGFKRITDEELDSIIGQQAPHEE